MSGAIGSSPRPNKVHLRGVHLPCNQGRTERGPYWNTKWSRTANPLREGTREQEMERDRMARVIDGRAERRGAACRVRSLWAYPGARHASCLPLAAAVVTGNFTPTNLYNACVVEPRLRQRRTVGPS